MRTLQCCFPDCTRKTFVDVLTREFYSDSIYSLSVTFIQWLTKQQDGTKDLPSFQALTAPRSKQRLLDCLSTWSKKSSATLKSYINDGWQRGAFPKINKSNAPAMLETSEGVATLNQLGVTK